MKIEAILFDLDGTLWNANESCTRAWNTLLERLNYSERLTVKAMDAVTGKPMDGCIDVLLPEIKKHHQDFKSLLIAAEREDLEKTGAVIYPDVLSGITELSVYYKIFIVSNCEEWYLNKFIDFSGLEKVLTDWNCYGSSKKEKHVMINDLKKNYNLESVIYIGDTMYDKEAARLSGSAFIQVTYGFGAPIENESRFDSFKELYTHLLNLASSGNR
jgi:phosphoglycolate phosphatase